MESLHRNWAARVFQIMTLYSKISTDPFQKGTSLSPKRNVIFLEPTSNGMENIFNGLEARNDGINGDTITWDDIDIDCEVSPPTLIEISYAMDEHGSGPTLNLTSDATKRMLREYLQNLEIHLTSRCAGLLEISTPETGDKLHDLYSPLRCIRWMHRTARDFIHEDDEWRNTLANLEVEESYVYARLLKAGHASICILKSLTSDETATLGIEANALIFAYHANGHEPTRHARTKVLEEIMRRQIWTGNFDLEEGTLYCLSDFVADTLAKKDAMMRNRSSKRLLRHLCSTFSITTRIYPFPTTKMVNCLLEMGDFPCRHLPMEVLGDLIWSWPRLVQRHGEDTRRLHIKYSEIDRFYQSQIDVVAAFLEANVDPLGTLACISMPSDFTLCRKTTRQSVRR